MKFIVTGSSGFIGQRLIHQLQNQSLDCIGLTRNTRTNADIAVDWKTINSTQLSSYLDSDTTIIHLAGMSDVQASILDPVNSFNETTNCFQKVLEASVIKNSRVLYISSAAVVAPDNNGKVFESSPVRPLSPYAAAKLACEGLLHSYVKSYGLCGSIIRLFSVYGPNMNKFFIFDAIKKIEAAKNSANFKGSGSQERDYLYIDDAVRGLINFSTKFEPGEIYNLCSGTPRRLVDIAHQIKIFLGQEHISIKFDNELQKYQSDVFFGCNKKRITINFEEKTSFEQGLLNTVNAVRTR